MAKVAPTPSQGNYDTALALLTRSQTNLRMENETLIHKLTKVKSRISKTHEAESKARLMRKATNYMNKLRTNGEYMKQLSDQVSSVSQKMRRATISGSLRLQSALYRYLQRFLKSPSRQPTFDLPISPPVGRSMTSEMVSIQKEEEVYPKNKKKRRSSSLRLKGSTAAEKSNVQAALTNANRSPVPEKSIKIYSPKALRTSPKESTSNVVVNTKSTVLDSATDPTVVVTTGSPNNTTTVIIQPAPKVYKKEVISTPFDSPIAKSVTTVATAAKLGKAKSKKIFPLASEESNQVKVIKAESEVSSSPSVAIQNAQASSTPLKKMKDHRHNIDISSPPVKNSVKAAPSGKIVKMDKIGVHDEGNTSPKNISPRRSKSKSPKSRSQESLARKVDKLKKVALANAKSRVSKLVEHVEQSCLLQASEGHFSANVALPSCCIQRYYKKQLTSRLNSLGLKTRFPEDTLVQNEDLINVLVSWEE